MVERYPDTVEVISSSLIAPTIKFKGLQEVISVNPFFVPCKKFLGDTLHLFLL